MIIKAFHQVQKGVFEGNPKNCLTDFCGSDKGTLCAKSPLLCGLEALYCVKE